MRRPGRRGASSPADRAKNVTPRDAVPPPRAGAQAVPANPSATAPGGPAPDGDPFPREEVGAFIRRLPAYAHLAWNLARDPMVSKSRRAAVLAAAGYLVSPIDLVPGIIPVIGQLDDLLVLLAALRLALAGLDPEQRALRLQAVGLSDELLADDAHALGLTAAWLARSGARVAVRLGVRGARTGTDVARRMAPVAARGVQRAGQASLHLSQRSAQRAGQVIGERIPGRTGPEPEAGASISAIDDEPGGG